MAKLPDKITTYLQDAVNRLVSQFRGKPKIEGLLKSLINQTQDLEEVAFQLIAFRWLNAAIGQQLDNFGKIVGELRGGRNDEDYRLALVARIAINNSKGTPEEVITIFNLLTGSTSTDLTEPFPAEVDLTGNANFEFAYTGDGPDAFAFAGGIDGAGFGDYFDADVGGPFNGLIIKDVESLYELMDSVLAAGVSLGHLIYAPDPAFAFAGGPDGLGFGDANDPAVGGKFAEIIV